MTTGERPDPTPQLGAAIRAAREAAGKSVEQVSAATRIRATVVRDLEADQLGSSGGTVYARGHLKSIASALGTDPAPLLAAFDRDLGRTAAAPVEVALPGPVAPTSFGGSALLTGAGLAPDRHGPRWGAAVAAAAAVLVGIVAIGYASGPDKGTADDLAAGGQPSPTPSAAPSQAPVTAPDPGAVASKPPVTGAQLRVRVIDGASWVSIRNARTTLFEGVLRTGQFKDFADAAKLRVTIGNAAAINLNCGGIDSGPAGKSGAVVRFACTAAGLAPA